ncbi:hypothetical protein EAI_11600, partial [Harpegnathos saltator]
IAASILEASMKILGFSVRSKNLKGTYEKVLRDASVAIAAGTTIMADRMAIGEGGNQDILEELREENARLRTSQEDTNRKMEELK